MFLTKEEVHELTGYVRSADQCRWLKQRGWKFEVSRIGRPVVLRKHVEEMLSLPVTTKEAVRPEPKLNMDAFRKKSK
ncbi:MAG: DUF4224 domain-containing protein [Gammaproteobacteria bacterium]|nr:DUF4224 domain-containing protein [Gammaproteobacteria bacterium]MBU1602540.1 DUF4224 domain-containing protein [Gammaproteobacteria bacterium]MBU2433345.1 DUF4224 domain-containing protein [Gammaproteobacteria bacterium]MBU2451261.1 DUF4224 domain-containing protein [Gammaproteobacteria bacterium]